MVAFLEMHNGNLCRKCVVMKNGSNAILLRFFKERF